MCGQQWGWAGTRCRASSSCRCRRCRARPLRCLELRCRRCSAPVVPAPTAPPLATLLPALPPRPHPGAAQHDAPLLRPLLRPSGGHGAHGREPAGRAVAAGRGRRLARLPAPVQAAGPRADQVRAGARAACARFWQSPLALLDRLSTFCVRSMSAPFTAWLPLSSMATRVLDIALLVLLAHLPTAPSRARLALVGVHLARMAVANATRPLMRSGAPWCCRVQAGRGAAVAAQRTAPACLPPQPSCPPTHRALLPLHLVSASAANPLTAGLMDFVPRRHLPTIPARRCHCPPPSCLLLPQC